MMKMCWRSIFFKALEVSPAYVPQVVACCTVAHNVALLNGDIVEPEYEGDHDEDTFVCLPSMSMTTCKSKLTG